MLLSFSILEMLPYLRAGAREAMGEDVGSARVKRQTVRRYSPFYDRVLNHDKISGTIPYALHLWWKCRTKERDLIGVMDHPPAVPRVYRITILHSYTQSPGGPKEQCLKIDGCYRWDEDDSCYFWSPGNRDNKFERFAYADGFGTVEAFRDFFVPNEGDVFEGVLFKW